MIDGKAYTYLKKFINENLFLTIEELNTLETIEKEIKRNKNMEEKIKISENKNKKNEFTHSEQKIFDCLMDGLTYKDTATLLVLAPTTVKTHVNSIFQKRAVTSLHELVVDEYKKRLSKLQKEHLSTVVELKAGSVLAKIENRLQETQEELKNTATEVGYLYLDSKSIDFELREKAEVLMQKIQVYKEILNEVINE